MQDPEEKKVMSCVTFCFSPPVMIPGKHVNDFSAHVCCVVETLALQIYAPVQPGVCCPFSSLHESCAYKESVNVLNYVFHCKTVEFEGHAAPLLPHYLIVCM